MRFAAITLFPEMFTAVTHSGITRRAFETQKAEFLAINPRTFCHDPHRTVDDRPYGGGPGMVMLAEPLAEAVAAAKAAVGNSVVVYLSPQGERMNEKVLQELQAHAGLVLLCGRYEGVDERLISRHVDREVSLGDVVISGGELAAMVLMDALIRRIPGVLNDQQSAVEESFVQGLLDWPHYTRPEQWGDEPVPAVLLSGNHALIRRWRLKQAMIRTQLRRPDLFAAWPAGRAMSKEEAKLVIEIQQEREQSRRE